MTDLGDMLGLPAPPPRPARARIRCRACRHLVYADQAVFGMGRCCAERHGLIVRRWRLPTDPTPDTPALFDRPEDLMDPYPQPRIDVAGLNPAAAHCRILSYVRTIALDSGTPMVGVPAEVSEAAAAQWAGMLRIIERHAPQYPPTPGSCAHRGCLDQDLTWPCPDYRDATAGLAEGLPAVPAVTGYAPEARP